MPSSRLFACKSIQLIQREFELGPQVNNSDPLSIKTPARLIAVFFCLLYNLKLRDLLSVRLPSKFKSPTVLHSWSEKRWIPAVAPNQFFCVLFSLS